MAVSGGSGPLACGPSLDGTDVTRACLNRGGLVLGVITHYRCESWLAQAIESLVSQTRSLDGIVVVDDASERPPIDIVRRFPGVTLLAAAENAGPLHLIQTVIENTSYDAYLQQDADDWSSPDRLALLLAEAERTGAELLGTYSLNVGSDGAQHSGELRCHPVDVNAAYRQLPDGWFLTWGTSIVTRDLVMRIGGLATGLRVAADTDFVRRAHHAARIVNVPRCCYYRRWRPDALTSAPDTGHGSPLRNAERTQSRARAVENAGAVAAGRRPNLSPMAVAPPIELRHILGPPLRGGVAGSTTR